MQLHVCCVKIQNNLSVEHGIERDKTKIKIITNIAIACNCCYKK